MNYNIAKILDLLDTALSDQELQALCQAHFSKVYNQFTSGQTKSEKIRWLVEYAQRQRLLPKLLQQVETINQAVYKEYEPYDEGDAVAPPIDDGGLSPPKLKTGDKYGDNPPPAEGAGSAQVPKVSVGTALTQEVVLVLHGIRDQGEWQDIVKNVLQQIPQTKVIPVKYEFFDLFRFWFPILTRRGPIERTLHELRDAQNNYRGAKVSVIAHSFGTYVITEILKNDSTITLNRLILCGAVVPRAFNWSRYRRQVDCNIINDCGISDIWPVLAQSASWGYGASGTFGFGGSSVIDRYHQFGHSGFLKNEFVTRYWLPWFYNEELVEGDSPSARSYFWSLLTVPFLQIKVLCPLAILTSLYHVDFMGVHEHLVCLFKSLWPG